MRGSSWHAFLGILVFFLGFSFIHLCSSAPSSSRNNLLGFWNLCDQWTIFQSLSQHPSEDLSLSKVSPGFLVSFQFQGSDDIFATYFPPTRWCSGWGYSSQVRLGGKRSLKKVLINEEMTIAFTIIQVLGTENIVFSLSNDDLWALLLCFVMYKQ